MTVVYIILFCLAIFSATGGVQAVLEHPEKMRKLNAKWAMEARLKELRAERVVLLRQQLDRDIAQWEQDTGRKWKC